MAAQISDAGEGRAVRGPGKLSRRAVLAVAAAAVVLTGGALAVSHFTTSSSTGGRVVDGNTVEYTAGHQPLVPDFTATSLTGTPVKMSSYRGKTLVLNIWGSWCGPCTAEAPTLEVAYQQYHAQGVDFLGDDVNETPSAVVGMVLGTVSFGGPATLLHEAEAAHA